MLKDKLTGEAIIAGFKGICSAIEKICSTVALVVKDEVDNYSEYEQLISSLKTLIKDTADIVQNYVGIANKTAGVNANKYMKQVTLFSSSLFLSVVEIMKRILK